jgi:two-component system, NarL family, sensor histidine kinase UhpB
MPESRLKSLISQLTHGLLKHDVAAVVGLAALSIALSAHFQLTEALYALTRRWEYIQLDELQIGMLVLTIGLIWLSWRRYRQAGRELHARELAEARLAGVLADNRKLAQEHLRTQELARKHLAREMHDELGQYLNAIKLDAVSICEINGSDAQFSTQASLSIIRSVDHVHAAVSDMIRRLRPVGLDELGLLAAIEHCVDRWRERLPDTRFSFSARGEFDALDEPLTLTLYRLIQEGLTNIYKHAGAAHVDIVLERRPSAAPDGADELFLTVTDDGRGMESGAQTSGFGLSGMRERVEMTGGTFLLESAPGRGLCFEARLPVAAQKSW